MSFIPKDCGFTRGEGKGENDLSSKGYVLRYVSYLLAGFVFLTPQVIRGD